MPLADSAGTPFAGREFHPNPLAGDDGEAAPALLAALERLRAGDGGEPEVIEALRGARLLVPLMAVRGNEGVGPHGQVVDKTQELSIVTVTAPDGRAVLPAFSSVAALTEWNPAARPIPVDAPRAALAAASEGTDLLVLDATSPTEFAVRRPALRALATGASWRPAWTDAEVQGAFAAAAEPEPAVRAVELAPGDPESRLRGPEVAVVLSLEAGLGRTELDALLTRLQERWAVDAVIGERVDSIGVRLVAA